MPYEAWLKAKAPPWLQDQYGHAWLGGLGATLDDYAQQYIQGTLAAFPEYAPADALGVLGDELGLDQGPNESNASFASRLRAAWMYWSFAGTPLGILTALYFAGFTGAVILQQNGLAYSLSGAPQPGVDPTSLLTVTNESQLAVALTSSVSPPTVSSQGRSIPANTSWAAFDFNTDFCSRFCVLFPGPLPEIFYYSNNARATFNGSSLASVTWPTPYATVTDYLTIVGPPVITVGSTAVSVAVDRTSKTTTGCNVKSSASFTGYVDVSAAPGLNATDAARLASVIKKWRPAKATCVGVYVVVNDACWDWPVTTWGDGTNWTNSELISIAGSF